MRFRHKREGVFRAGHRGRRKSGERIRRRRAGCGRAGDIRARTRRHFEQAASRRIVGREDSRRAVDLGRDRHGRGHSRRGVVVSGNIHPSPWFWARNGLRFRFRGGCLSKVLIFDSAAVLKGDLSVRTVCRSSACPFLSIRQNPFGSAFNVKLRRGNKSFVVGTSHWYRVNPFRYPFVTQVIVKGSSMASIQARIRMTF